MHPTATLTAPYTEPSNQSTSLPVPSLIPRKRLCSHVSEHYTEPDYAQYGASTGKLTCRRGGDKTCMVFSKGWPSWFWAALSRSFVVKIVVLGDIQWKWAVKAASPSVEVLGWEAVAACNWPTVDIVFSDYDLRGKLMPLWNYISKYLILSKASHKPPPSWGYAKVCLWHMECGGVTDGKWWAHVYSTISPLDVILPTQAKRDLSTIIETMNSGGHGATLAQLLHQFPGLRYPK